MKRFALNSECPVCLTRFNVATSPALREPPKEGQFCICTQCGAICRFDEKCNCVPASDDDLEQCKPRQRFLMRRDSEIIKSLRKKKP